MSQIINIWEMLKGQNLGAYLLLHICLAIIWIEMGLHIISMIIHLISVNHQMRAEVPGSRWLGHISSDLVTFQGFHSSLNID